MGMAIGRTKLENATDHRTSNVDRPSSSGFNFPKTSSNDLRNLVCVELTRWLSTKQCVEKLHEEVLFYAVQSAGCVFVPTRKPRMHTAPKVAIDN